MTGGKESSELRAARNGCNRTVTDLLAIRYEGIAFRSQDLAQESPQVTDVTGDRLFYSIL